MKITVAEWKALHDSGGKNRTAKRKEQNDRRVERRLDRQAIGKRTGWAGFSTPPPMKVSSTMTSEKTGAFYCTVHIGGLRLISELNRREHHMVTHRRKKAQQDIVHYAMLTSADDWKVFSLPVVVTFTRLAPRFICDDDNLKSCAKHVRDQVAREFGIDDGDKRVTWNVEQRKTPEYGLEIRIEAKS